MRERQRDRRHGDTREMTEEEKREPETLTEIDRERKKVTKRQSREKRQRWKNEKLILLFFLL